MRVAFSGGGTGGHVYPALTVAAALRVAGPGVELLYLGVRGRIDGELVARAGIAFEPITARPLRVGSLTGGAKGGIAVAAGAAEATRILRRFRPDAVFATGGYGSVGAGFAARLLRLPLVLFEPGPESGLAVRLLARLATTVVVTIPPALRGMPAEKTRLIGYPVRPGFFAAGRDAGRAHFGLDADLPALLVSGASSGASVINKAVAAFAPGFLRSAQLIHLSGARDEEWLRSERAALPEELQPRYHLHAYLHDDMALAFAAADLAVMRSGASVLGELPAAGLPAVLIPGEYEGWDQSANARYLESEGAATLLPQSRLDALHPTVMQLIADTRRLAAMRDTLARLARPDAAQQIARLVLDSAARHRVPA